MKQEKYIYYILYTLQCILYSIYSIKIQYLHQRKFCVRPYIFKMMMYRIWIALQVIHIFSIFMYIYYFFSCILFIYFVVAFSIFYLYLCFEKSLLIRGWKEMVSIYLILLSKIILYLQYTYLSNLTLEGVWFLD